MDKDHANQSYPEWIRDHLFFYDYESEMIKFRYLYLMRITPLVNFVYGTI